MCWVIESESFHHFVKLWTHRTIVSITVYTLCVQHQIMHCSVTLRKVKGYLLVCPIRCLVSSFLYSLLSRWTYPYCREDLSHSYHHCSVNICNYPINHWWNQCSYK
jgi:hypothetical protein